MEKQPTALKNFFLNHLYQIHWFWRVVIFMFFFISASYVLLNVLLSGIEKPKESGIMRDFLILLPNAVMAVAVIMITWIVLKSADKRDFGSVGLAFHSRWRPELMFGLVIGTLIPFFIAMILTALGMITFQFRGMDYGDAWFGILINLATWITLAFFYELIFRGYLLQTMAEGIGKIAASLALSVFYGLILGSGPHQPFVSVINVCLAGLIYCFCYFRTRALWAGLGIHISWNFIQSYVLGSRVERFESSYSIFKTEYNENIWWNGGHFGLDGGWAATFILLIFVWYVSHTRMLSMSEDMKKIKFMALTTPFKMPDGYEKEK